MLVRKWGSCRYSNDGGRDSDASGAAREVVIIDDIAEVQCLVKPDCIRQLASKFTGQLIETYSGSDEIHVVVFDQYDVTISFKTFTRQKRQGG